MIFKKGCSVNYFDFPVQIEKPERVGSGIYLSFDDTPNQVTVFFSVLFSVISCLHSGQR